MSRNNRTLATVGAVGVALITLSGCGAKGPTSTAAAPPATSVSAPATTTTTPPTTTPLTTTQPAPSPTTAPPPSPAPPSLAQLQNQLVSMTSGARVTVIALPGGGYDAMVSSNNHNVGQVSFWHHEKSWRKVGDSTFPYENGAVAQRPLTDEVTARVLPGMSHPIFILRGIFSGDSTAHAISYTDGPRGWGVIKAQPNGNLASSGQGVGFGEPGLEDDAYFTDGLYETAECSLTLSSAECGGNQRVEKFWGWNGTELTLQRTAGLPR